MRTTVQSTTRRCRHRQMHRRARERSHIKSESRPHFNEGDFVSAKLDCRNEFNFKTKIYNLERVIRPSFQYIHNLYPFDPFVYIPMRVMVFPNDFVYTERHENMHIYTYEKDR